MNQKAVEFETFPLGDTSGTRRTMDCDYGTAVTAASIANVDAFEPHTAEGIDLYAQNEFRCESSTTYDVTGTKISNDLLLPKTAMIHAIGLTADNYGAMALKNTALIWSPRSNITLYGDTARVTTAHRFGVEIALGTDWTPTGSMNMLRELRCADSLNKTYYDNYFTDKQLWEMTTLNAAAVTATDDVIGLLAPNHVADISIFKGKAGGPFRSIIDADPQDVVLVMRGGKALFGDDASIAALSSDCDTIDVCGTGKRVCLKSEIGKTLAEVQAAVGTIYPAFFCAVPDKEPSCTPKRPAAVSGSTIYTGAISADDSDGDGLPDTADNCPKVFNPIRPMDGGKQPDTDNDMAGDACDPCPTDANTTACTPVNPDDRDHDGFINSADNCPDTANPGQSDGDMDGHGDACDACPSNANPGTAGCPATIYAIKKGEVSTGTTVRIENALVTGKGTNGFFMQTKAGDAGYMGADFSGIFVYTGAMAPTLAKATVGLRVTVDGKVTNFQNQLELDTVASVTPTTMVGEAAPTPVATTYADVKTGGPKAAAYEAVLISVGAATVSALNATFGEYTLTAGSDTLIVDDFLYVTPANGSAVGTSYSTVIGILALRQQASKLEPRSAADLVQGTPTLAAFGPALGFVRAGQSGVNSIPAGMELTVTLSGPAQGNTDVTVSSPSGDVVVVGGKVTVLNGETTAKVVLDGVNQNTTPITLTAQLGGGAAKTAQVRVLGANEAPTSVSIAPTSTAVAPLGSATFTATLDIPAPPGGTSLTLGVSPGTSGSTNPATTLVIAADTLSNTFVYGDATGANATVSAALSGGNTANATVTVNAGASHLVINEVDYDNTGAVPPNDNAEYIEIYNPTSSAVSLANVALVLINGSTGDAYPNADSIIDLSSAGSIPAGGYLVVAGQALAVAPPALKFEPGWTTDGIQNGNPDGVALVDTSTNTLLDALSYEGSVTAANVPGIANPVSLVEGTALSTSIADSNTVLGSLCRSPNGRDTDSASADWKFCTSLTPGTANP
ncbi:MAG TPA: thrombospondin type 3 repeat-containing protein [Kofleriaceae bacterium]|nr:thrombospondin type 3 repeat-containing protein [Kofleriaceae bacterium]